MLQFFWGGAVGGSAGKLKCETRLKGADANTENFEPFVEGGRRGGGGNGHTSPKCGERPLGMASFPPYWAGVVPRLSPSPPSFSMEEAVKWPGEQWLKMREVAGMQSIWRAGLVGTGRGADPGPVQAGVQGWSELPQLRASHERPVQAGHHSRQARAR